jgi:superfamily I DNA and/or RNA helicase
LRSFDRKFKSDNDIIKENEKLPHEKRKPINTKLDDIYEYKGLLYQATLEELDQYDVIFCTTSLAANVKLLKATKDRVSQVIIDECGMCSEPESMLPIIATHANQVVLIGDHKQLRPIIKCREASDLGLGKSLFERYSTEQGLMTMLQEQYRMVNIILKPKCQGLGLWCLMPLSTI